MMKKIKKVAIMLLVDSILVCAQGFLPTLKEIIFSLKPNVK